MKVEKIIRYLLLSFIAFTTNTGYSESLSVYGWETSAPSFLQAVKPIEKKLGFEIKYTGISVENYNSSLEWQLIYDAEVDVVGLMAASTARYYEAGWLEPLSDEKKLLEISEKYYKHLSNAVVYKGKLLGVPAGAVVCNFPVVDMDQYRATGLSELPKNWGSFYNQIIDLANTEQGFYLPFWHKSDLGLAVSFIAEVLNRGGRVINPETEYSAMQAKNKSSAVYETLVDWRRVWHSGAIPSHVLELNYYQFYQDFLDNRYTFSSLCSHFLMKVNSLPATSGRELVPLPIDKQSWGSISVGTYSITKRASDRKSKMAKEFLYDFVLGEGSARFSVSKLMLETNGVFPIFPEYVATPEVKQIIGHKLPRSEDAQTLIDIYESAPYPSAEYSLQWYEEFSSRLHAELINYLKNPNIAPEQAITRINKHIENIRSNFGY